MRKKNILILSCLLAIFANTQNSTAQQQPTDDTSGRFSSLVYTEKPQGGWKSWSSFEYGFLPKPETQYYTAENNHGTGFSLKLGANFWLKDEDSDFISKKFNNLGFFAGVGIGYSYAKIVYDTRGWYGGTNTAHLINIPVHIGYAIPIIGTKIVLTPTVGAAANICVKAQEDCGDNNKYDIPCKVGFDAKIGTTVRIWGQGINFYYNLPLNDSQKMYYTDKGYFSIGVSYGL